MVAISFLPQFADLVASGHKCQTIRTKERCKPGDRLQLYTGMRTKSCRKLVSKDPVCQFVCKVTLYRNGPIIYGDACPHYQDEHEFARADGFESYGHMYDWFLERYGYEEFDGFLIVWAKSTGEASNG